MKKGVKIMIDLKPCPFCGHPVQMVYNSCDNAFKIFHKNVVAEMCCCVIDPIMIKGKSLADAAKAWNRRADNG